MKKFKAFAIIVLFMSLLFGATSCMVVPRPAKADNGVHKGFYKSSPKASKAKSITPAKAKKGHRK